MFLCVSYILFYIIFIGNTIGMIAKIILFQEVNKIFLDFFRTNELKNQLCFIVLDHIKYLCLESFPAASVFRSHKPVFHA